MRTVDLTQGKVSQAMVKQAFPMWFGMLAMMLFNAVDTWFVSKLGTDFLTAMGFTFSVVMVQGAIAIGLGVGASALISRSFGQKDMLTARALTTHALLLSLSVALVVALIGILTIDPLFRALGAEGKILSLVHDYMLIWYIGLPFVVIPMVGNNAIRSAGNTSIPSKIMLVAVVVNSILDPLLIFGVGPFPRMEIQGAALATVIARMTTMFASLWVLSKMDLLRLKELFLKDFIQNCKRILQIGAPAAFSQLMGPIAIGYTTAIMANYGKYGVAAFGVVGRVEMLLLTPVMALGAVIVPFMGQNMGGGKLDRVEQGMVFSWKLSAVYGVFAWLLLLFVSRPVVMIFDDHTKVVEIAVAMLWIVPLGYLGHGVVNTCVGVMNAFHKPLQATWFNFLRLVLLYIPLAFLGGKLWGYKGIASGLVVASLTTALIAGLSTKKFVQKELKTTG